MVVLLIRHCDLSIIAHFFALVTVVVFQSFYLLHVDLHVCSVLGLHILQVAVFVPNPPSYFLDILPRVVVEIINL